MPLADRCNSLGDVLSKESEDRPDSFRKKFIKAGAHDLLMPLAVARESLNLLLDGLVGETTQKQKEILKTAKQSVDKTAKIINTLIEAAKDKEAGDGSG